MDEISGLIIKMTEFFSGDPKRIQHFIKVFSGGPQAGNQRAGGVCGGGLRHGL